MTQPADSSAKKNDDSPPIRLRIRPAQSSDSATILGFIQELADYEKLRHECVATEAAIRATLFGDRPAAEAIIASLDDEPVGFALFFTSYSTFLAQPGIYLEDLYVTESARGKGVGKSLLAALAQITIARGGARLEWSVLDWNAPAIEFYRRLGAEPVEPWTRFRVVDESLADLAKFASGQA